MIVLGKNIEKLNIELWRNKVEKNNNWVCDTCTKFFTHEPITGQGKMRVLHFCSLKCKSIWVKKKIMGR